MKTSDHFSCQGLVPREHLVRTNTQFGLRPDDADAAIARLSVQVCSCEVCQDGS